MNCTPWLAGLVFLVAALPARGDDETIRWILRKDGAVKQDSKRKGNPVYAISLGFTRVTDSDLKRLAVFPDLQILDLFSTSIGDAGLAHLKAFKKLEALDISYTKVTDEGLKKLKPLTRLRSLDISYSKVA